MLVIRIFYALIECSYLGVKHWFLWACWDY